MSKISYINYGVKLMYNKSVKFKKSLLYVIQKEFIQILTIMGILIYLFMFKRELIINIFIVITPLILGGILFTEVKIYRMGK